jgi:hypothetical protein
MGRLAVFVSAVVPGIMLLAYGVAKTRSSWNNEALWTAFVMGGVGAVAAIPLELVLERLLRRSRRSWEDSRSSSAVSRWVLSFSR